MHHVRLPLRHDCVGGRQVGGVGAAHAVGRHAPGTGGGQGGGLGCLKFNVQHTDIPGDNPCIRVPGLRILRRV